MPERNTHVTQYGRIRQVALQTWHRQLHSQMLKNSVCYAQITFGIFKVNRIYLMRHCAWTNLSGFNLLFEILHRDILPEVTVHVNHHRIDALHCIEDGGQIVIIGNLSRIFFTLQAQLLCDKFIAESFPVILRISHVMRIVITRSATKFSGYRASLQRSQLTFQTVHEHHHLFSQTSGRSRLPVRLGKHRDIRPLFRIRTELGYQFLYLRIIHLLQSLFHRQRNRSIVNILWSQPEVDKFFVIIHSTQLVKFFFQEILHSLHVMIRHAFNILDASGVGFGKVTVDVPQCLEHALIHPFQLR